MLDAHGQAENLAGRRLPLEDLDPVAPQEHPHRLGAAGVLDAQADRLVLPDDAEARRVEECHAPSRSCAWPVTSPCSGARKPRACAASGTSCTTPSVTRIAPATRSGGTSARPDCKAEKSRVPSVPPDASRASIVRISTLGSAASRRFSASATASVCAARLSSACEAERSTTTATTSFSRSRSSRTKEGLNKARMKNATASARNVAPVWRTSSARMAAPAAMSEITTTIGSGSRGDQSMELMRAPSPASLAEPLEESRHVHLVRFVVACQRVHHDVDARPIGELALARQSRLQRVEWFPAPARRPRGGEVVRGDDDRRHPSPARAGRSASGPSRGSASIQVCPSAYRPGKVSIR